MLNHQHKLGEKLVVTSGDKLRRGGYLKYDLELRESDAVCPCYACLPVLPVSYIIVSFQIVFTRSLDIFSGSEYRAQLVLRNHMQTDKYSNLVNVARVETARESVIFTHLKLNFRLPKTSLSA